MTIPFNSQFFLNDEQTDGAGTTGQSGGGTRSTPTPTPTPTTTPASDFSGICREYSLTTIAQAGSDVTVTVIYTDCGNNVVNSTGVINLIQQASADPDAAGQQLFSTTICSKSQPSITAGPYQISVTNIAACDSPPPESLTEVTLDAFNGGSIDIIAGALVGAPRRSVIIDAFPISTHTFSRFELRDSVTNNLIRTQTTAPISFTVDENRTITAFFELTVTPLLTAVTLAAEPSIGGSINIVSGELVGSARRTVRINAVPANTHTFSRFELRDGTTDNLISTQTTTPISFTVDGNRTVTAFFELIGGPPPSTVVTLVAEPPIGGSINIVSGELDGPVRRTVRINAAPANTHTFTKFELRDSVTNNLISTQTTTPISFTVDGNRTVTAFFELIGAPRRYTTTLVAAPTEGGVVSGTSLLTPIPSTVIVSRLGERTNFQATANSGYTFVGWYLNGLLWSTNYSPAILSDKDDVYEARFARNPTQDKCKCYFVAPTAQGQSFEVTYRPCVAGSIRTTETFTSFTNICSADIPQAGRNAQVPQNLGTDCSNGQTCNTPPPPTPTPTPTPTEEIILRWRDCISEELYTGVPTNRREVVYTGPGGGTCWEPLTQITFTPDLNNELTFQYQRGSTQYPMAQVITATNASTQLTYEIQIITNPDIAVTPNKFIIAPRSDVQFVVQTTAALLNQLGDGTSRLQMSVGIREL